MTSIERDNLPPNNITKDDAVKVIREAQTALQLAGTTVVKYRTIIKAQSARIAELEEYIGRLESSINRSHHHMTANNKAVALNILRAYITEEKENGESDKADVAAEAATQAEECGITPMDLSGFDATLHGDSEARPDDGPAARGKSAIVRECYYDTIRPETMPAFTATARGERYLRLVEQLGDDSRTFRAWWPNN